MKTSCIPRLSGNTLKLIAAFTMLIDHIGAVLFPRVRLLRIIGRLAFPIFAYFIAEGCHHTRSKKRYFFTVAGSGILFQAVYFVFSGSKHMNIFITFALSMLMIFPMQALKSALFTDKRDPVKAVVATSILTVAIPGVFVITQICTVDYGFAGCMIPFFASMFMMPVNSNEAIKHLDTCALRAVTTLAGLLCLAIDLGANQIYSLLAVPLLLLYSGERGLYRMKYFFYVFYPAHLIILQGISILMK